MKRLSLILALLMIYVFMIQSCSQWQQKQPVDNKTKTEELPKTITGKDGAEMVLIPAGKFQMGTDKSEVPELFRWSKKWYPNPYGYVTGKREFVENEMPSHTVYVDAFYMDVHEVTNAQYMKFTQATGYREPEVVILIKNQLIVEHDENGNSRLINPILKPWSDPRFNSDDQPVVCVTQADANAYAKWAGKRLPTEAEWEKAARGGLVGKRFPWGNDDPDGTKCNFSNEDISDGYEFTAPVKKYPSNGYGLYDMAGNVLEWCNDFHGENYYKISSRQNPKGPNSGTYKVVRGGSWSSDPFYLRVSSRYKYDDDIGRSPSIGFRCCVSLPDSR